MRIRDIKNGGYFTEHFPDGDKLEIKNTLVATGASWFLRTMFRGEAVLPATYYMGLTNSAYTFDTATLVLMAAGEPVGNGYARQPLVKNTVDWTVSEINGVMQALSKNVTFACTGAPWTQNWVRAFLCDQAAGTAGNVISVSGPTPSPRSVLVGQGPTLNYTYYLRG